MLLDNKRFVVAAVHNFVLVFRQIPCTISIFVFYFELLTSLSVGFDAFVGEVYPRYLH